jgi:DNA uptake protein ComE-like DNA-binding protein
MRFARFTRLFLALVISAFLSIAVAMAQSPSQTSTTSKPQGENAKSDKARSGAAGSPTTPTGKLVDINSASSDDLKALPGIGDVYAKKIIDGRPYANKTQLKSKGIVPASTYDKISGQIVARHGATAKQTPQ